MTIAITAQLDRNPWKNKGKQSSINLYDAIQNLGEKVCYIIESRNYKNFNKDHIAYTEENISQRGAPNVSLLILDGYVPQIDFFEKFLARHPKCRIVHRHEENPFAATCSMISNGTKKPHLEFVGEVWLPPHQIKHKDYILAFYSKGCIAKESPFLWSPFFIHEAQRRFPDKAMRFDPQRQRGISIMEKNIDFTKNCLFPLLATERLNIDHPELVDNVSVFNTQALKKTNVIQRFCKGTSISKQGKLFLSNDWEAPDIFSKAGQYIVSHQLQSELNYAHLECLYLDIPLVHNSKSINACGYYYKKNSLPHASNQIANALINHTENLAEYRNSSRELLVKFSPGYRENALILEALISGK